MNATGALRKNRTYANDMAKPLAAHHIYISPSEYTSNWQLYGICVVRPMARASHTSVETAALQKCARRRARPEVEVGLLMYAISTLDQIQCHMAYTAAIDAKTTGVNVSELPDSFAVERRRTTWWEKTIAVDDVASASCKGSEYAHADLTKSHSNDEGIENDKGSNSLGTALNERRIFASWINCVLHCDVGVFRRVGK